MKITVADARLFAEELETGRGRMGAFARQHPWLMDLSQQVVGELCGGPAVCFRSVYLRPGATLRSEGDVSTTLSPVYAAKYAAEAPVLMSREGFSVTSPTLLRYELPLDRVLLYIPTAIAIVRDRRSSALARMKIRTRGNERLSALDVFDAIESLNEHEVFVDASGVEPEAMTLSNTRDGWFARDWLLGSFTNGEEAFDFVQSNSSAIYYPRHEYVQKYQALIDRLQVFFRPPICVYKAYASRRS